MNIDPDDHGKALRVLEQVWPVAAGAILTMAAGIQTMWNTHKNTRRRIAILETIAEHVVTQQEMQVCKDLMRDEHDSNIEKLYREIKENNQENHRQHQDMMNTIIKIHENRI